MVQFWYITTNVERDAMHIRFADADANFMKAAVEKGFYTSETELVRDAVRRLREQQMHASPLFQAVMKGRQDIDEGRTTPYSADLMSDIKQRALEAAENKEPYHSNNAVPY
jgi:antitoxin ParD1/3/4